MNRLGNGAEANSGHEELLRRALIKVSLAASGVHTRLDEALNRLRKTIREGGDIEAVQADVETVTDILREIGDETSLRLRASLNPTELLNAFAGQRLPEPVAEAFAQLQRRPPDNSEAMAAGIVKACMKWPKSQSLFGRWFGKSDGASNGAMAPMSGADLTEPLLRVLANVKLPEQHRDALEQIKARLEQLHDIEELPEAIGQLAETLLDASSIEQAQFEQFLTQLNARLSKVQLFLDSSQNRQQEEGSDGQQLQQDMHQHMSALRVQLRDAKDLKELQVGIDQQIDNIIKRVDSYQLNQQQRLQQNEQDLLLLREQLRATEDEAARLRENLSEQRHRANTDALTRMPNRHAYHERLTQEYNRWRRYRHKLALAIGDIDHFKRINDMHGHMAGDAILKQVAQILTGAIRESDFVARHGGEEFVLLMPETGLQEAQIAVNKLREQIAAQPLLAEKHSLPVTISFGVAEFEGDDVPRDVYTRADTALYKAKTKGRNTVVVERRPAEKSSGN